MYLLFICGFMSLCSGQELFHEGLSEQEKVDYFGVEARYNVPEYAVVSPRRLSKHKQFPVYSIKALGEDYLLHLSPNHRLTTPGCVVHHRKPNNAHHVYPCMSKGDNCHYHGTSLHHNFSVAAVSNCNGLEGVVSTKDHELILKPIRNQHLSRVRRDTALVDPHIVYKKNAGILQKHTCSVTGPNKYSSHHRKSRTKRQVASEKYLEMALIADKDMFNYHGDKLRNYMLTVANIAAARFTEPSLRQLIIFTVVKLEILEEDLPDLQITEEADDTLTRFCDWQEQFNEPDDNSPLHYDGISLLTRLDISHEGIRSNTGLGTVGGMCTPNARCTYCEDTGLDLGLTLAHETGHTLGMVHDGNDDYCADGKYIMSGSGGGGPESFMWSPCSANALDEFLGDENSYCMDDFPTGDAINLPKELPGVIYSADEQCHLFLGAGSKICLGTSLVEQFNNDECARLVCYDPRNSGQCIGSQSPRMDGSECGDRKWCIKGRCVKIGTKGPQPINGGWSAWDADWSGCSRSCGGGVRTKSRKCNNPSPRFGGFDCEGESLKAELCNKKDCTTSQYEFKEEQCAATDNEPLFDTTYHWIPYDIIGEEECFRYCQTVGNDGQIQLRTINNNENYTDGTICFGDFQLADYTRCVQGRCRAFSCDGESDVAQAFDVCGVCGGEGSTCLQHTGTFNKGEKQRYISFVMIPAGSTGIYISNQHSDFTSMRIKVENEILFNKADGKIDGSGIYTTSGVKVKYIRRLRQPEVMEIVGPIPVNIEAQVWKNFGSDGFNTSPDIYYEYYTPLVDEKKKKKKKSYKWSTLTEGCSMTCGGGQMKMKVDCKDTVSNETVTDKHCPAEDKPATYGAMCNEEPCPPSWRPGKFSGCTVTCDGGIKKRTIDCVQTINHKLSVVGADNCVGEKPAETERCGELSCPGVWNVDSWSQCSQTCGFGVKQRKVDCVKNNTAQTSVADIQCDFFNKPNITERCLLAPCYTNITGEDCVDKAVCSGRGNICQEYPDYAKTDCQFHCGYCVKTSTVKVDSLCEDSAVCRGHKKDVCQNYEQWSKLNCPKLCSHCVDNMCQDKVDCQKYGTKVCTDYTEWSQLNCRKFCNICQNTSNVAAKQQVNTTPSTLNLVSKQQSTTTPSATSFENVSMTTSCSDSSEKCKNYGKSVCKDYRQWATIYCRKYCDFCSGKVQSRQPFKRETTVSPQKETAIFKLMKLTTIKDALKFNSKPYLHKLTTNKKGLVNHILNHVKAPHLPLKTTGLQFSQPTVKSNMLAKEYHNTLKSKGVQLLPSTQTNSKSTKGSKLWPTTKATHTLLKNKGKQLFLKFLPNVIESKCFDVVDCSSYDSSVCTDYVKWSHTNCRRFCGICVPNVLLTNRPRKPAPTSHSTTRMFTNLTIVCQDVLDNCDHYGKTVCQKEHYKTWVVHFCRKFCGLCPQKFKPRAKMLTTSACRDRLPNCNIYSKGLCKKYSDWSMLNCPVYCNLCFNLTGTNQSDSLSLRTNMVMATNNDSMATEVDQVDGCHDKVDCKAYGQTVCTNYKQWSDINCQKFCDVCSTNTRK